MYPYAFVLGLCFLFLKLNETIDWSWWLVTLPFYYPFAIAATLVVFWVLVIAVMCVGTVCFVLIATMADLFAYLFRRK